jgi:hypothetical protein
MGIREKIAAAVIFGSFAVLGQKLDLSSLDALAARAKKTENVTLDGERLKLASQFLSRDGDEREARQLMNRLTGVFVRTFEFDSPLALGSPELQAIRNQLNVPGWAKIVDSKDKDQNEETQVYLFSKNGNMGGLAVISAERKELTVVNVAGSIDFEDLKKLRGSMGIRGFGPTKPAPPAPPAPPPPPARPKKDE